MRWESVSGVACIFVGFFVKIWREEPKKTREVVAVSWNWADELFDFAFRCSAGTTTNNTTNNSHHALLVL